MKKPTKINFDPNALVCGVDEAGRGALAGPLVTAAVIPAISKRKLLAMAKTPIRDGKTLSAIQRMRIYKALIDTGATYAIEIISARSINNRGIARANKEGMRRLIKKIHADIYIVDGN